MQCQRDGLVPIGDALSDLDGPVTALREATPQARHHFTRTDQVDQLVSASEADPDLEALWRELMALCSPAPHQPRQPERVQARQRSLHALHDRYRQQQAPLRQFAPPLAGLGFDRSGTDPKPRVDPGVFAIGALSEETGLSRRDAPCSVFG